MNKKYKSWELIKAINDGKIKSGTQIRVHRPFGNKILTVDYWFWGNWFGKEDGYSNPIDNIELYLCDNDNTFEVIEKNETYINNKIDIDNIKEYKQEHTERCIDVDIRNKINELVRAVKQLNTELKNRGDLQ